MVPYLCPVCQGRGIVPPDFYTPVRPTTSTLPTWATCRACDGKGVLWAGAPATYPQAREKDSVVPFRPWRQIDLGPDDLTYSTLPTNYDGWILY